jgi:hypothetical protein
MIYIHYSNGRVLQGVVLAFGDHVVRVAIKDSGDAAEYRLVNQVWVSEDCEVVRMEFAGSDSLVKFDDPDPLEAMLELCLAPRAVSRVM